MYLYTIYYPLLFLYILRGTKKVEDIVPPAEEGPFLQFLNMNGSEKTQGNTIQHGSGQYNTKVLTEFQKT